MIPDDRPDRSKIDGLSVRPASAADSREIVRIHLASFRGFFLTSLGAFFLRTYYGSVRDFDEGILLVATARSGETLGFAAGNLRPDEFHRYLRRNAIRFLPGLTLAVLRRPWLVIRVLRSAWPAAGPREPRYVVPRGNCELSSLAVDPRWSGSGVGRALVVAFLDEAGRRGADRVVLTTDADENERVNRFYRSLGFTKSREFAAGPRRVKNEYEIMLT